MVSKNLECQTCGSENISKNGKKKPNTSYENKTSCAQNHLLL